MLIFVGNYVLKMNIDSHLVKRQMKIFDDHQTDWCVLVGCKGFLLMVIDYVEPVAILMFLVSCN